MVEYVLESWGVCWGRGDPSLLVWIWAHTSWVVFRVADGAAEDLCGLPCSIGVGNKCDPLDKVFPLSECVVILCGGEDVDIPDWLFFALACANVILFDEVEVVDRYRFLEKSYCVFQVGDDCG